jgi:hypothetical protein
MRDRPVPFVVAVIVAALAAVLAPVADGAVFARLLRTEAHVGDVVPLYLVSAAATSAFTTTRGAPRRLPYIRLRDTRWGRPGSAKGTIRFRVPKLKSGRYRLVIYCESCTGGALGSVIGSVNTLRVG